jgi:hypothetical protein
LKASEPVNHPRKRHDMTDFAMLFGLYCISQGVSRKQYSMFKEMLAMLGAEGAAKKKIDDLPDTVDTLKRHVREELPLLDLRAQPIALNPDKLPSSRLQENVIAGRENINPVQDLIFLNPIDTFKRVIASRLHADMHFGMAHLVDKPSEAWHCTQWASSIRTTSGEFAYYPPIAGAHQPSGLEPSELREPIFPGDIINFRCARQDDWCRNTEDPTMVHVGQVLEIYRDHRESTRRLGAFADKLSKSDEVEKGEIVLVAARIWRGTNLLSMLEKRKIQVKNPLTPADLNPGENILMSDPIELINVSSVVGRYERLTFDYAFGSRCKFDDDPPPNNSQIRRVFSLEDSAFLPVCKFAPPAGVLEVREFGREQLIKMFVVRTTNKVRSVPLLTSADGFGLYRTMYKSVMGVYNEIAALPAKEHSRQITFLSTDVRPPWFQLLRRYEDFAAYDCLG